MANISNTVSGTTVVGSADADTIYNSAQKVSIHSGDGNDRIYNYYDGKVSTVDAGNGNDTIYNAAYGSKIFGGAGDDSISFNNSYVTVFGGYGNDTIRAIDTWGSSIDAGDGDDVIKLDKSQSQYNYPTRGTINSGKGNDTIYNNVDTVFSGGSLFIYNNGDGNDTFYGLNSKDTLKISGVSYTTSKSGDSDLIINVGSNSILVKDGINAGFKIDGQEIGVDDTLYGSYSKDIFYYAKGNGNDIIIDYSGEDTIEITDGKVDSYSFDGGDLIFKIGDGSLRLKNAANHYVTVKDSTGTSTKLYTNGYTPQQVIKNFVKSSANSVFHNQLSLDEAVQSSSHFKSLQEVIDQMVADARKVGNATIFLRDYCGITTNNADNGAAFGWETGGAEIKTSSTLYAQEGEAVYPESTTFTIRGVTFTVPEKDTLTKDEQLIVKGFYSWWAEDALKLVEDSYGVTLEGHSVNLKFRNIGGFGSAYAGGNTITIEMKGRSVNESYLKSYLSSTIAHEMTHIMDEYYNVTNSFEPRYMSEGLARLTEGGSGSSLVSDPEKLSYYLDLSKRFDYNEDPDGYSEMYSLVILSGVI